MDASAEGGSTEAGGGASGESATSHAGAGPRDEGGAGGEAGAATSAVMAGQGGAEDSPHVPPNFPAPPLGNGNSTEAELGPHGGTLQLGSVELIVPPDALATSTPIRLTEVAGALDPELGHAATPLYRLEPSGLTFAESITVRFPAPARTDELGLAVLWSRLEDDDAFEEVAREIVDGWVYVRSAHFSGWAGVYPGEPPTAATGSCGDGVVGSWPRYDYETASWREWVEDCDDGADNTTQCPYPPIGNRPVECSVCDPVSCLATQGTLAFCGDGRLQAFSSPSRQWFELGERDAAGLWQGLPPEATSYTAGGYAYEVCDLGRRAIKVPLVCPYGLRTQQECTFCNSGCLSVTRRSPRYCGDGVLQGADEVCDDGNNVTEECPYADLDCQLCNADCSAPIPLAYCGNDHVEASEQCDGKALEGLSCADFGFDTGALRCTNGCTLDTTACRSLKIKSLGVNTGYTCVVWLDGSLACWGRNDQRNAEPPAGSFERVYTAHDYACALDADGAPRCWGACPGAQSCGPLAAPNGPFTTLALGTYGGTTCGLRPNGTVLCWDSTGAATIDTKPSQGQFVEIGIGPDLNGQSSPLCGLLQSGDLLCWEPNKADFGASQGVFQHLSLAGFQGAALEPNGKLRSWGVNGPFLSSVPFSEVSVMSLPCGVLSNGDAGCYEQPGGALVVHPGPFTSVVAGGLANCGVRADGSFECWRFEEQLGTASSAETELPQIGFTELSVAPNRLASMATVCTLGGGQLDCFGGDPSLEAVPAGNFTALAVGYPLDAASAFACALRADRTIACWGGATAMQALEIPSGTFQQLSPRIRQVFALRSDGTITCFGESCDAFAPPSGTFSKLGSGVSPCAIRAADGSLACWGNPDIGPDPNELPYGVVPLPSGGGFVEVATTTSYGCARKTDGKLACFGKDLLGTTVPPTDSFLSLALTPRRALGLRHDGTIAIWGDLGDSPQTDHETSHLYPPPAGPFVRLSASPASACALTAAGELTCWGKDYARLP